MTYEEVKAKARQMGIPEEDHTPEVLKQLGYTFPDPTRNVTPSEPKLTSDELREHLSMLEAEQKANGAPPQAIKLLARIAGAVLLVVMAVAFVIGATGCGSSEAAQRATAAEEDSNQAAFEDLTALCLAQAEDARNKDRAKAEELFNDSVRSVTKKVTTTEKRPMQVRVVAPDGTSTEKTEFQDVTVEKIVINPDTYDALYQDKLDKFEAIERNMQIIREKIAAIARNRANARALNQGLRQYFKQKADAMETANLATDALIETLDRFVGKKKTGEAAP